MKGFEKFIGALETFLKYALVGMAFIKALKVFYNECKSIDLNKETISSDDTN